jgi:hypothetical protein
LPALTPTLWSFALGQMLFVTSAQDCPAPAAVDARVRGILGLGANVALEERAKVDRNGSSLHVTLAGHDGRVIGDRWLQADGTCNELAGVVAVVLSAWLSDIHSEFVVSLPEPTPLPSPSPAPPPVDEPTPARPASHRVALGVAFGADLSGHAPAPFAAAGVRFMPVSSGFGLAATATIIGARTEELSSGSLRYWRWPMLLGPALRIPVASAKLDLQAGAALAWLHLEGVGFALSSQHDAFVGAGFFSTRISQASQSFEPFAEVTGVVWPSAQAFVVRGGDEIALDLPSLELQVSLGVSLRGW